MNDNDKHNSQDSGYFWSEQEWEIVFGSFKSSRKVFFLKLDGKQMQRCKFIVLIYAYFICIIYRYRFHNF